MSDSVTCKDKICSLEVRLVEICVKYLPDNSTECNIPCNLDACRFVLKDATLCPIWKCENIDPQTTTPSPLPGPDGSSLALYVLGIIFGLIAMSATLASLVLKRRLVFQRISHLWRRGTRRNTNSQAFNDENDSDPQSTPENVGGETQFVSVDLHANPFDDDDSEELVYLTRSLPAQASNWDFPSVSSSFMESASATASSNITSSKEKLEKLKELLGLRSKYERLE